MKQVFKDTPLKLQQVDIGWNGRVYYELMEDLIFQYSINGSGVKIIVPKGFVTDFATIPRILWSIFPPAGKHSKATVIHDYLYTLPKCSRFLADSIFREAMYQSGVNIFQRVIMYYGVRIFGGLFRKIYNKK